MASTNATAQAARPFLSLWERTAPRSLRRRERVVRLRKYRKGHLLRADVVGEILGRNDQAILAGRQIVRNSKFAGVRARIRIPRDVDRRHTVHSRDDGPGGGRRADIYAYHVASAIAG